jgi:hypothetical protein
VKSEVQEPLIEAVTPPNSGFKKPWQNYGNLFDGVKKWLSEEDDDFNDK